MGSKSRIVNNILPIIQKRLEDYNIKTYIEPFCGGCNVIDKVVCDKKIASDNNKYLIELFKNIDKIDLLPEIASYEHYCECRDAYNNSDFSNFPKWYIGMIGFLASYSGRFYDGGFNGTGYLEGRTKRNYYDEAKRNLAAQVKDLDGIDFVYGDYFDLYKDNEDCLFYCDIPYKDTKQYNTSRNFDYEKFWDWAERMSEKNIVLVSEYQAPKQWECIWEKPLLKTMNHGEKC
jgi:DNA adenine methylase